MSVVLNEKCLECLKLAVRQVSQDLRVRASKATTTRRMRARPLVTCEQVLFKFTPQHRTALSVGACAQTKLTRFRVLWQIAQS